MQKKLVQTGDKGLQIGIYFKGLALGKDLYLFKHHIIGIVIYGKDQRRVQDFFIKGRFHFQVGADNFSSEAELQPKGAKKCLPHFKIFPPDLIHQEHMPLGTTHLWQRFTSFAIFILEKVLQVRHRVSFLINPFVTE